MVIKGSVLVPDRYGKAIMQYSLTGKIERLIPCPLMANDLTWLCVTSSRHESVIVSCRNTISCINMSTRECVWSVASVEKPIAVCCDDADRVYVAIGGRCYTTRITVLDQGTGKKSAGPFNASQFSQILTHTHRERGGRGMGRGSRMGRGREWEMGREREREG